MWPAVYVKCHKRTLLWIVAIEMKFDLICFDYPPLLWLVLLQCMLLLTAAAILLLFVEVLNNSSWLLNLQWGIAICPRWEVYYTHACIQQYSLMLKERKPTSKSFSSSHGILNHVFMSITQATQGLDYMPAQTLNFSQHMSIATCLIWWTHKKGHPKPS